MIRINLDEAFEEMRKRSVFSEYQTIANNIIESYDFNDIKRAIKYAESKNVNKKNVSFSEGIRIMNNLFNDAIKWLQENGRRV